MSFWKKRSESNSQKKAGGPSSVSDVEKQKEKSVATAAAPQSAPLQNAAASTPVEDPTIYAIEQRFGKVRSALSAGTNIQGKLSFDVAVRIDGELGGEIYSSQPIIVGPKGRISASIETSSLIVLGKVEGDVTARERVEVLKGGSLSGDIRSPVFVLEEEGNFNGSLAMKV